MIYFLSSCVSLNFFKLLWPSIPRFFPTEKLPLAFSQTAFITSRFPFSRLDKPFSSDYNTKKSRRAVFLLPAATIFRERNFFMEPKTKQSLLVTVVGVTLFVALLRLSDVLAFAAKLIDLVLPILAGGILALFINARFGVNPTLREVELPISEVVVPENHEALERGRKGRITEPGNTDTRYQELLKKHDAVMVENQTYVEQLIELGVIVI
jgi:hypothetical protein